MMKHLISASRRFSARVAIPDGVWVYWQSDGREETSRVRDMSLGGLFLETTRLRPVGSTAEVDFLVQEGQIRVKTIVRHAANGRGMGLKFTAVSEPDRARLVKLIGRFRSVPCSPPHPA